LGDGDTSSALLGNPAYDATPTSCNGGIPIGSGWIDQNVWVPGGHPTLTFQYDLWSQDKLDGTYDTFDVYVDVLGDSNHLLFRNLTTRNGSGCGSSSVDFGWQSAGPIDLTSYAAGMHTFYFVVYSRQPTPSPGANNNTYVYLDSVAINP
jgi:hypothetical protein